VPDERLHKRIAASGLCSRRAAEKLILEGLVAVNGVTVTELGTKVGPEDQVSVNGKLLETAKLHYIVLNKPRGYVTTLADPHAKRTVKDLFPDLGVQLKPVGRLDKDTEGLLLATNDGQLALRLTHPRYGVEKEYQVAVEGKLSEKAEKQLTHGIYIEGGKTAPAKVEGLFYDENKKWTFFRMTIHEGRKRQIRQMCLAVGNPVKKLKRVRFGPVHLDKLPRGTCRVLGKQEVDALRSVVGLEPEKNPKRMKPKDPA
jgi:23S rRNA pseudouridine2605 synthase